MIVTSSLLSKYFSEMDAFSTYEGGHQTEHWTVLPIIESLAARRKLSFESCLDIGAADRPKFDWFTKTFKGADPQKFVALEVDEKLRTKLAEMNIPSVSSFYAVPDRSYDLSLALEVVEHISPKDSVGFLKEVARVTKHMFAMTVPNFEYWDSRLRAKPEIKGMRWAPDHFPAYEPKSDNPHKHKQLTTPDAIRAHFLKAFDKSEWSFEVFRAWPWEIKDKARGQETTLYFKVFAVAIRK